MVEMRLHKVIGLIKLIRNHRVKAFVIRQQAFFKKKAKLRLVRVIQVKIVKTVVIITLFIIAGLLGLRLINSFISPELQVCATYLFFELPGVIRLIY